MTRDDEVTVPLTLEQANDSREGACRSPHSSTLGFQKYALAVCHACAALTKAIYGKQFAWLVARCNAMLTDDAVVAAFVGILDIFGFEDFKVNSFEQLTINYANERLQQQFNWCACELLMNSYFVSLRFCLSTVCAL